MKCWFCNHEEHLDGPCEEANACVSSGSGKCGCVFTLLEPDLPIVVEETFSKEFFEMLADDNGFPPEDCVVEFIGLAPPTRATTGSSGYDLESNINLCLYPGEVSSIPTGLKLVIPPGYEGQIRPRSGLARYRGVTVLNAPGTIDSDYRGEIEVLLINHGPQKFQITPGDRIAQLVFAKVANVGFSKILELPLTERGGGGFGSTGT